jgi:YVTN family beta-propeller protein
MTKRFPFNSDTSRKLCLTTLALSTVLFVLSCSAPPAPGYKVYVSNEQDNTVTVLDSGTLTVLKTINVGARPRGITATKDGKHVLVCASDDDIIQIIDTATYQVVDTLPSNADPELFVLAPSGNPLYIANEEDNLVTVVDVVKKQIIKNIPVGVEPEGMAGGWSTRLKPQAWRTLSIQKAMK